jgi:(p)ppGpp synthase/HD superfamily hydrolase
MSKRTKLPQLVENAIIFATRAHNGQTRKYTGEPYITHPLAVMHTLYDLGITDPAMLTAAVLHDTVEDTPITLQEIERRFGPLVSQMVYDLTDISTADHGTRAQRKAIDREHLRNADNRSKTIKLADLLDNTKSIVEHDPGFALVYIPEKLALLEVLKGGNAILWKRAHTAVMSAAISMKLAG